MPINFPFLHNNRPGFDTVLPKRTTPHLRWVIHILLLEIYFGRTWQSDQIHATPHVSFEMVHVPNLLIRPLNNPAFYIDSLISIINGKFLGRVEDGMIWPHSDL